MTCEEAIKRLYDALNSGAEKLTSEMMAKHYELCRSCCSHCRFDAQVIKAMQENCHKDKPTPALRSKILKNIDLHG